MQRTFVAITLALAMTCAFSATFTFQNYVKGPIVVIQDNETNYTNATNGNGLQLASIKDGELDILATTYVANNATPVNASANAWTAVYRKLDGKALSGNANTTLNFTAPASVSYTNGYAISINVESDAGTNNIPQIVVYQTPVTGGAALARLTVSSNTVNTYQPSLAAVGAIGKNIYLFYIANNGNVTNPTQVNVTSFTVGGAKGSLEFNLTTTFTSGLSVAWGEALGNNQLYASWVEGASNTTYVRRYTTIDVTKGTYNGTATASSYLNSTTCQAFSTDKKWYGDLCFWVNRTENVNTINYYIRFSNGTFLPFNSNATLYSNTSSLYALQPYGPYLAVFYKDTVTNKDVNTYSYEIWNLDSLTTFKAKTTFLTTDIQTQFFRVVGGGIYTLTYVANIANATLNHFTSIQVGLVLGSSYLTSVLGFIMTVVAGVLLF